MQLVRISLPYLILSTIEVGELARFSQWIGDEIHQPNYCTFNKKRYFR